MTKVCAICGNEINFLDEKLKFKDGYVGKECYNKVGLTESWASMTWADQHCVNDVKKLLDNEIVIDPKFELKKVKEAKKNEKEKVKQDYKDLVEFYKDNNSLCSEDYFFNDEKRMFFKKKSFLNYETFEYSYDDILEASRDSYTTQSTNVKKKHGVTRAVTGGVIAGTLGAVVGAASGIKCQLIPLLLIL